MSDIRVRVGQQNAIKVISSSTGTTGTFVGIAGYAYTCGISSYSNYSGISSYSNYSGISSYSNYSGISSYSNYSGISTFALNIFGGSSNNLVYQSSSGVTTFVPQGTFGQVLYVSVTGKPQWISQPPATLVNGLTVINQNDIVGLANSISILRIVGSGLSASLGITSNMANLEIVEIDGGEY